MVHRVFEAGEKNKNKQNKFITLEQAQKIDAVPFFIKKFFSGGLCAPHFFTYIHISHHCERAMDFGSLTSRYLIFLMAKAWTGYMGTVHRTTSRTRRASLG